MLECDANLSSTAIDPALMDIRLDQYNRICNEMHLDDLPLLEKDLAFLEKVSLLFLLNGHSPETSQLLLQRLTISLHAAADESYPTNYLQDWARTTADWARILVEALAIVQANRVLRRLGLDVNVIADLDLLPRRPDIGTRVHPILKWLHFICEQLLPEDTRILINSVCEKFPDDRYRLRNIPAPTPTERYLEMWMLVWLAERLVEAGDWAPNASSRNRKVHCRLDAMLIAMKTSGNAKLLSLHHRLESAQNRFNCTSANVITFDPKSKEKEMKVRAGEQQMRALSEQQLGDGDGGLSCLSSGIQRPAIVSSKSGSKNKMKDDEDDRDRYVIRSDKVGIALIINQDTFYVTKVYINSLIFHNFKNVDQS